jgi:hypothetical protein
MSSCGQFDYDEVTIVYGLSPSPRHDARIGLEGHESVRDLRAKPSQHCAI